MRILQNVTAAIQGAISQAEKRPVAPGERESFNTKILDWWEEGGVGPQGRITPLARGWAECVRGAEKLVPLLLQPSFKSSRLSPPF